MDLDCSFGAIFMRNLWPKNDRLPNRLYDAGVSISNHISGETASDFVFFLWLNFRTFSSVVVSNMAKNYVHILGGCHWLCDANTDHDLYVSI